MAQINPKITIRFVYFGMLLLVATVMILTVRLTVAFEIDSLKVLAEQGYPSAQFNLGNMYDTGEGVPQNDAEAVQWFRMAAEQGFARAQFNLAYMYLSGRGVPKDYVQVYAWLSIAAAQGDESVKENLENITRNMTTADITKAQELSHEYWEAYGPSRVSSE